VEQRRFALDDLRERRELPVEPDFGIESVRVRKLALAPRGSNAGKLTIEAPAGSPDMSVYDLGDRWFAEKARLLRKFAVIQATIAVHLHKLPDRKRARTIHIQLTRPNSSNLKDLSEADRTIAEAHIEKWGLIEAAR